MKQENEALREGLMAETHVAVTLENTQVAQQLARLMNQKETYQRKIEAEMSRQQQTEDEIKSMKQKLQEERLRFGGANGSKEHTQLVSKQLKILENRLEKVYDTVMLLNAISC